MMLHRARIKIFLAGVMLALLCIALPAQQKEQKHLLVFDRRHQSGDRYHIYYYLERETKYIMPIQGIKNPPLRTDKQKVVLSGRLNCIVAEKIYELIIQDISLTENGVAQKMHGLQGKTLEIDIAEHRINIRNAEAEDPGSFFQLSPAGSADRSFDLSEKEEKLLWSIFGSQGDHAAVVFGKNCMRKKGERWSLQTDWIQNLMKQRGIRSSAENWDSTATFEGVYPVKNIPANMVSVHLFSKKIPSYDCKIDIAISLPTDEKLNHGPIQIICDGLEIEQTALPGNQPFCNGATFFVERRHQSLYTLTPAND